MGMMGKERGMGKKKKRQKIILPPELPPEIPEDEIEVSDEDLQFVDENRDCAGFVSTLDTHSITRHVSRVADVKEDALEALYERRLKKKAVEKQKEESLLQVDPVDALPVKTLDGELYYRTVPRKPKDSENAADKDEADGEDGNEGVDKSVVKLTKAERRAKLKKSKKEAKKQGKELDKTEDVQQTPQAAVLFVDENRDYAGFVSTLDTHSITSTRRNGKNMDEVDENFPLFSKRKPTPKPSKNSTTTAATSPQNANPEQQLTKATNPTSPSSTFADLGLAEWAVQTCKELGMPRPTPVQHHCIPRILAGDDVLGLAQTGSGKTAAFALPILHRLAEDPFGVFALVVTPTRELAYQLAEQFRALGSCLHLRCAVVVGGMDRINQAQTLMQRPHVIIATPGRVKVLLEDNPDIPAVFARTKFLVLDEADRVLDVGFEEELRVVFQCLPKNRQTLLFSATMTSDLQTLLELSANKAYFYEAYEGFKTVESLKQQYIFVPKNVKDVYLLHIISKMEEMGIRSAIIFVSTCRSCHLLSLLLEELDLEVAALHSFKSQSLRLSAVHRFKSGQVPILLATDVASRGLDIPTVDLVVNYDIPRYPRDYVHRVGRTARAGRGGLSLSFVTQNDVDLIHEIEAVLGKQLDKFDCKEKEVLDNITKVYKARRVATMKMMDDGFEEKAKARKAQKLKTLAEKGLLKKKTRKRKREKARKIGD